MDWLDAINDSGDSGIVPIPSDSKNDLGYASYRLPEGRLPEGGMEFANLQLSCEQHAEYQRQRVQALPIWLQEEREAVLNNGHNG